MLLPKTKGQGKWPSESRKFSRGPLTFKLNVLLHVRGMATNNFTHNATELSFVFLYLSNTRAKSFYFFQEGLYKAKLLAAL